MAALSAAPPRHSRLAAIVGWASGMAADLDIIIRSEKDPLLTLEYHRHFTHALAFIPIGGLLCAAAFYPFLRQRLGFARLCLYSTIGYATAGLLDACTSYGTQLLWPFSDARISWNIISVVDPLYTAPLVAGTLAASLRRKPAWARRAAVFSLAYLALGIAQRERASAVQQQLAEQRGHAPRAEATVKPSFGNLLLWRSLYKFGGQYYVDAVWVGPLGGSRHYEGHSVPKYDISAALASLPEESRLAHDLRRFDHFSEGYLAQLSDQPVFITDLRYSALPHRLDPLWGIELPRDLDPHQRVSFVAERHFDEEMRRAFGRMLLGRPLQTVSSSDGGAPP